MVISGLRAKNFPHYQVLMAETAAVAVEPEVAAAGVTAAAAAVAEQAVPVAATGLPEHRAAPVVAPEDRVENAKE